MSNNLSFSLSSLSPPPPPSLFSPLRLQISSRLPLILLGFYGPATTVTVTATTTTNTTTTPSSLRLGRTMVSLRRRKNLGLCAGRTSFLAPLPKFSENGSAVVNQVQPARPFSVHPVPSDDAKPTVVNSAKLGPGSSNVSGSSSSREQHSKPFSGQEIKRRKRHRRKHFQDQEPCVMRGVYFKNMKWQAAIKVDKKQIHLGTVGSQEEAAHLYDRAAFMCGREPNFELPEEEKDELRQFKWEEFLAMTRHAITNKKHKRRLGAGLQKHSEPQQQSSDAEAEQGTNGFSASEDVEPDTSA